jgi:hypothetical protein
MGFFPIFTIMVFIARRYQRQQYLGKEFREDIIDSFQSYGLLVAWSVFVLGIWQLASLFGLIEYSSAFWFL